MRRLSIETQIRQLYRRRRAHDRAARSVWRRVSWRAHLAAILGGAHG